MNVDFLPSALSMRLYSMIPKLFNVDKPVENYTLFRAEREIEKNERIS
jgi:hypothetical protein